MQLMASFEGQAPGLEEEIQQRGIGPIQFGCVVKQAFQVLGHIGLGLIVEQCVQVVCPLCEGNSYPTTCTITAVSEACSLRSDNIHPGLY